MGHIFYLLFAILVFSLEIKAYSIKVQFDSPGVTELRRTANQVPSNDLVPKQLIDNNINKNNLINKLIDSINEDNGLYMKQLIDYADGVESNTKQDSQENGDLDPPLSTRYKMPNFFSVAKRISEQKCMEYTYQLLKRQEDGNLYHSSEVGIINGKGTKEAEYPHMGALGWRSISKNNKYIFMCGASLISENFMLTAAHCTYMEKRDFTKNEPEIVRLGTRYLERSPHEMKKDVRIRELITYPFYHSPRKYYDIALVRLVERIAFTKHIQPACLPSTEAHYAVSRKKQFSVSGWGSTSKNKFIAPKQLLYGLVNIIDDTTCENLLKQRIRPSIWWKLQPDEMCAGDLSGNVDTCEGDSGGPLQYLLFNTTSAGSMHRLLSVTAFGLTACGTKNSPGIYTKVLRFVDWIEREVWLKRRHNY